jgi:hypothetical protein
MKSWAKPTPELVTRAIAGMPHSEQQRYFFDRLENPEWIEPLRKAKFFDQLPTPVKEEKSTGYYLWPASRYLSRMARYKPDLVAEIMFRFPATDNPFVIQDILDAAASMPPDSAAKLADAVARTPLSGRLVGMERTGEIASNLAQGGQMEAALKVLRSILEVVPDPRPIKIGPSGHEYRHEARTRIREFDYSNILRIYSATLTSSLGSRYLELLSKKLVVALSQERASDRKARRPVEDYSYIWRPHLEYGAVHQEAKQLLISGVLQSAEFMASNGAWADAALVLQRPSSAIFERIQLYLLAKYPDLDLELAAQKLTNADLFHYFGLRQEFNQLARVVFPLLSREQQERFFALIDAGFNTTRMVERGLTTEQIEQMLRQWKLERFEPVRDHLPPERQQELLELEGEFGKARKYENSVVRGGAVAPGGESPVSSEKLESMTIDELLELLKSWAPDSHTPFGPTEQGLGRELASIIRDHPERYWERLDDFKTLQPTYVRAMLQGFREAVRNNITLAWQPLLDLAEWICEQPSEKVTEVDEGQWHPPDSDWHPSRFAIIEILEDGLKKDLLPFAERTKIWKIIEILAEDESNCLDYRESSSLEKDVWSYSLNTLRPRAVRVAFNYIEWLHTHLKAEGSSVQAAPEIAQFLDRHLDVDAERCLAVRLIYGEKLPFLKMVDPTWVPNAITRIFPDDPALQPLRDVAWSAYLAANPAYTDLFFLLEPLYRNAIRVEDEARQQGTSHLMDRPSSLLGQHLIQMYWWDKVDLSEGSVLSDFLNNTTSTALRSTVTYVGRSLAEAQDAVAEDAIARLQLLWDYILASENAQNSSEVFANFGWWFNTRYFDDAWALDRLRASLRLANGKFEPVLDALSRLARLAATCPEIVLECTQMIVLAANDYVELWTNDIRTILETVLHSGDASLSAAALNLINELGTRGQHTYRLLLKPGLSSRNGG